MIKRLVPENFLRLLPSVILMAVIVLMVPSYSFSQEKEYIPDVPRENNLKFWIVTNSQPDGGIGVGGYSMEGLQP